MLRILMKISCEKHFLESLEFNLSTRKKYFMPLAMKELILLLRFIDFF